MLRKTTITMLAASVVVIPSATASTTPAGVGVAEMRAGLSECRRLAERWQGRVIVNGRSSDKPKELCRRNNHLVYRIIG